VSEEIRKAYATLGLPFGASRRELRRQYKKLVRTWHPDRFGGDPVGQATATEQLGRINRAYRAVLDELDLQAPAPVEAPPAGGGAPGWRPSSRLGRDEIDRLVRAIGTQGPVDWLIAKFDWLVWPLDTERVAARPLVPLVVGLGIGALLIAAGMRIGIGAHVTSTLLLAFLFVGSLLRRRTPGPKGGSSGR
jgi:hypothetical protein